MSQTSNNKYSMDIHEWIAVIIMGGVLTGLSIVTYINSDPCDEKPTGNQFYIKSPIVEIVIDGAVEKPGKYSIDKRISLMEAIQKAHPITEADLNPQKLAVEVGRKKKIHVPHKSQITVYLKGAVKTPGPITMRKGAQLQDITDIVVFEEEADIEMLRKKRVLKDKEEIIVPYCE